MKNSIDFYLDKLNLKDRPLQKVENSSTYFINLNGSNEFAKFYSLLDNADWISLNDGDLSLQNEFTNFLYINDDIMISLKGDLLNDSYTLEIREVK